MSPSRPGRSLALMATAAALLLLARTGAVAPAQEPAKAQEPSKENAGQPVVNLVAPYRLQERYSPLGEKAPAGTTGQFQVAFRETESGQNASGKTETYTRQAIFTERPVRVAPDDDRDVTDTIRHYTSVTITPDPWKDRKDRRPMEDLTIWSHNEPPSPPVVMVLTPGRSLRDEEYRFATIYDFVSDLAYLLPEIPLRIGETYQVPIRGAAALVNDRVLQGKLAGKFAEVRAHPQGKGVQLAILSISGKLVIGNEAEVRDVGVNARVEVAFRPAGDPAGIIDAPGAIEKVRLAQISSFRSQGEGDPPPPSRRDLILERKFPGTEPPLTVPNPPPTPTPENSWLTFTDPARRFHLRHPQGFEPTRVRDNPNALDLVLRRPLTRKFDVVRLEYQDRPIGKPQDLFNLLVEDWRKRDLDVQPGLSERLPETDWPDRSVYHIEAVLIDRQVPPRPGQERRYFDAFVVQFPKNVSLLVTATTYEDRPEEFRKQVLTMIKTIQLGAPKTEGDAARPEVSSRRASNGR